MGESAASSVGTTGLRFFHSPVERASADVDVDECVAFFEVIPSGEFLLELI